MITKSKFIQVKKWCDSQGGTLNSEGVCMIMPKGGGNSKDGVRTILLAFLVFLLHSSEGGV